MNPYQVPNLYIEPRGTWVYSWRRGAKWLYVGISATPLARIANHNIIGKSERLRDDDCVEILSVFTDWYDAQDEENRLRGEHRPKYNPLVEKKKMGDAKCIACKTPFTQKRWWQRFCTKDCQRGKRPRKQPQKPKLNVTGEHP